MAAIQAQMWKGSKFNIKREQGGTPGEVIFHFSGPFTMRDMYGSLAPDTVHDILTMPCDERPAVEIFDLSGVPYMDFAGLELIVKQYARCHSRGIQVIAIGVNGRVLERFRSAKMDALIPMASTVEGARVH